MHLPGSHAPVSQLPDQDSSLPALLLLAQALTVRSQLQTTTAVTARSSNSKGKAAGDSAAELSVRLWMCRLVACRATVFAFTACSCHSSVQSYQAKELAHDGSCRSAGNEAGAVHSAKLSHKHH